MVVGFLNNNAGILDLEETKESYTHFHISYQVPFYVVNFFCSVLVIHSFWSEYHTSDNTTQEFSYSSCLTQTDKFPTHFSFVKFLIFFYLHARNLQISCILENRNNTQVCFRCDTKANIPKLVVQLSQA